MSTNDLDASPRHIVGMIMWLCHRHRQRVSERMEQIGIGGGAGPILMTLGCCGEMNQKELAEKVHVSPATVSQTLKPLVKAGLIERKSDEKDARVFRLRLTQEGENKRKEAIEVFSRLDLDLLGPLSEEEQIVLTSLLHKMEAHMKGDAQ